MGSTPAMGVTPRERYYQLPGGPFPAMNRIRAARQALGWTQNDLATKANVSPRTVHAIEKGRPCRQATKRRILSALGVPWETRNEYFTTAHRVQSHHYQSESKTA